MLSWPERLSASMIAARSVHWPSVSAQVPSPGAASGESAVLSTVRVTLATVGGSASAADPASALSAWTSAMSTQPSPFASPGWFGPQIAPLIRAACHSARAVLRSSRSNRPLRISSRASPGRRAAGARPASEGAVSVSLPPETRTVTRWLRPVTSTGSPALSVAVSMTTRSWSRPGRCGSITTSTVCDVRPYAPIA